MITTEYISQLGCAFVCLIAISATTAFAQSNEPIQPLPPTPKLDPGKVALGQRLFNDVRLSKNNTISCASCHIFTMGGSNGQAIALGVNGAKGVVNTPTVFNSGLNFRQFWDGRAASLEEQAAGPINNPIEMASNWPEVIGKLSKDLPLVAEFKKLYPSDGVNAKNIMDALATYQRTLTTPDSRFDKFLRGNAQALTADEQRGYQLFKSYGCVACHQGVNIGGNMFQTFGVMGDYFAQRGNPTTADLGRYNVTRKDSDKHVFKVPSLRNVALTAPYFHDGSAGTLNDAVNVMFKYQLGREGSAQDKDLIVKFLNTLTGELNGKPLQPAAN
ncbi:MAG: cytochrome-c peroxidase [Methylobacillus sp.]|jgi:cytochrome c peroxidase|nr:cytochrome-c peroxidase [Methylobacillus sp.]